MEREGKGEREERDRLTDWFEGIGTCGSGGW